MTTKEKLIIKQIGHSAFSVYSILKNETLAAKEISYEIGTCKKAVNYQLRKLYLAGVVNKHRAYSNVFIYTIKNETEWKL